MRLYGDAARSTGTWMSLYVSSRLMTMSTERHSTLSSRCWIRFSSAASSMPVYNSRALRISFRIVSRKYWLWEEKIQKRERASSLWWNNTSAVNHLSFQYLYLVRHVVISPSLTQTSTFRMGKDDVYHQRLLFSKLPINIVRIKLFLVVKYLLEGHFLHDASINLFTMVL